MLPVGRRPDGGIFWVVEFVRSINYIALLPWVNNFIAAVGRFWLLPPWVKNSFCPSYWPWSNILFTLIGISLFSYSLAVQLPLLKRQHGRTGRNTLQPWVNNLLTLNLILCRKKTLNLRRISLLKRKAQHKGKRIQRKKHVRVKMQIARFTAPGFFLRRSWCFGLRLLPPSLPPWGRGP